MRQGTKEIEHSGFSASREAGGGGWASVVVRGAPLQLAPGAAPPAHDQA